MYKYCLFSLDKVHLSWDFASIGHHQNTGRFILCLFLKLLLFFHFEPKKAFRYSLFAFLNWFHFYNKISARHLTSSLLQVNLRFYITFFGKVSSCSLLFSQTQQHNKAWFVGSTTACSRVFSGWFIMWSRTNCFDADLPGYKQRARCESTQFRFLSWLGAKQSNYKCEHTLRLVKSPFPRAQFAHIRKHFSTTHIFAHCSVCLPISTAKSSN